MNVEDKRRLELLETKVRELERRLADTGREATYQQPLEQWLCITWQDIDKGTNATVTIFRGDTPGSESSIERTLEDVYNRWGNISASSSAGNWLWVRKMGGKYQIFMAECDPSGPPEPP